MSRSSCVLIFLLLFVINNSFSQATGTIYKTTTGKVTFVSDAPLEYISASSTALKGIIDTSRHAFAFSVPVSSFTGFNSPLQREHFNENYLESSLYPNATFSGKIIEEINYNTNGSYDIRAKGIMNIRGVKQERIIRSTITITDKGIDVKSSFTVSLADHDIRIPRVVYQKIAPDIKVDITAFLKRYTADE
jgi:hypothetical protein